MALDFSKFASSSLKLETKVRSEILRVKGTRHYQAELAFTGSELKQGDQVFLEPQPDNPHDKNAVVVLSCNRKILGHISKDVAAKYQKLCQQDLIHHVKVHTANRSSDHALFDIRISVTHTASSNDIESDLPYSPGTYELSLHSAISYIGATSNLNRRYRQHLNNQFLTVEENVEYLYHQFHKKRPLP